jgi:transposase-like protein
MEHYPRNLGEFNARFASDEACREYLRHLRWPKGFVCPRCGSNRSSPVRSALMRCHDCRHQVSVTAGTIFQDTHIPLRLWFQAMWWVSRQKNGASALGLQHILGLSRYETAWTMLHRLRRAMARPGSDLLTGRVEVDECYLGGSEEDLPGSLNLDKTLVVVAAQVDLQGIGKVRMRRIPDASAASLMPFIQESVAPECVVHTDGWLGYSPLKSKGFAHRITLFKGREDADSEMLPRVHLVIAQLKRWLMGTHQGAVGNKHLDYYLDEFTFGFNRRKSRSRGKLFFGLAQQAVAVDPVTHYQIVHPDNEAYGSKRPSLGVL